MEITEKPSSKGQAWFCTTGLPSDIVVEVQDMTFHLHKFPLISKSRKLHNLITEQEANPTQASQQELEDEADEIEEVHCQIVLPSFPGGSETFEIAAKFCYGVKIDLNSSNVGPLRCAGEYLEMTEEYSEDNLVSKTERFLSQAVFKSFKDSIKALKSCERVMPLAESLGITQRCIDAVANRGSNADPSLFGWPVNEAATKLHQSLRNGIDRNTGGEGGRRRKGISRGATHSDSWVEDLVMLSLPFFKRLIVSMKSGNLSHEMLEIYLMCYAKKYIPGVSRSTRTPSSSNAGSSSSSLASESQQRELLETIVADLPLEKTARHSVTSTRFLFGLIRTANILNASVGCKAALEKKIGLQLEQASLDDLLIPSYSYLNETLYDIDCVERIVSNFLEGLDHHRRNRNGIEEDGEEEEVVERDTEVAASSPALMLVGKLTDEYLSEIASDANLKPDRFYSFAMALPERARPFDDGLYRAVDVYLKAHPWISELEREKICGILDCQKLTLEACTHAAQNEQLPLRAVVQVLFFEQLQLRHAIAGTLVAGDSAQPESSRPSVLQREAESEEGEEEENGGALVVHAEEGGGGGGVWRSAVRENQVLRLDMDSMRTRVHQLERECSNMKRVIETIDHKVPSSEPDGRTGWKDSLTRRFGCKLKTQVCDSHEPTVVEGRKGRRHHHQH